MPQFLRDTLGVFMHHPVRCVLDLAPPPANKLVSAWRYLTIDIPLRLKIVATVRRDRKSVV